MTIDRFFKEGKLLTIPRKTKDKELIFDYLSTQFSEEKSYTEKEVNEILKAFYPDYAILRRFLVDHHYLIRDAYGKSYQKNTEKISK
ncbi:MULTISPECIES: DUF2087 domain-containing protein [Enterococcus]|uniref:DUF2087 domain-containing protein n=1 Tax=Enterococcus sulfureus ATCC 49903 TaxID=1140003 RepID=S0KNZ9_9ENTE|nr:DUF2087 domain-containing protein [Enterococcus sulfureus]EOT46514.1 hypothetical protein OMY_01663 [Enterococcus sulfureus ATCC 49903]EOT86173.1 hypothetical protein I573_00926 [Enterococcus sulfureus ATCC 49903]